MTAGLAARVTAQPGWKARLQLQVERTERGSRLTQCEHYGPLYVQKPFYPEGPELAHIYPLHPPGGVVSGDELAIAVTVGEDAGALLTTPGAARMYRARSGGLPQRQRVQLKVGAGATLEWLPLETIVFNGACVELETTVELAAGSLFAAWEITCFGLPASAVSFSEGSFSQRYVIEHEGRPLFVESLRLAADDLSLLSSQAGLGGAPVAGFFLIGPVNELAEELLAALVSSVAAAGLTSVAAVGVVGDCVVGRYLGSSAEQARQLFGSWWQLLRPQLIGRSACQPRIWAT